MSTLNSNIKQWSTTPASNGVSPNIVPYGWPEGMAPSAVNDTARQQMADHRYQWEDAQWFAWGDTVSKASGTTFKIASDVTSRYLVNRRIKVFASSTMYATIATSSYSAPDTTVGLTFDTSSDTLGASFTAVALSILTPSNNAIPAGTRIRSPYLTSPIIDTNIYDLNNKTIFGFDPAAGTPVNYLGVANSATGAALSMSAYGTDGNIDISVSGKGVGRTQIKGTGSNNNVSTGYVGEYMSSNVPFASGVNVSPSGTIVNITTLSLTAGDWDVWGNFATSITTGPTTVMRGWISTTSVTLPNQSLVSQQSVPSGATSGNGDAIAPIRISIAATTTVYLSGTAFFTGGSATLSGNLYARRAS